MRLRHGKWSWSIRALLVSLAVLPPLAVLLLVVASTLATRMAELGAEMDQRGRLLASAISESSRYGVQAENREILERTLAALATSDRGIAELEIMNHQREVVASYRASVARRSDISFEEPVFPRVVAIDPNEVAGRAAGNDRQAIGYVRVKLTSEPMEAAKRKAIVVAIVFAASPGHERPSFPSPASKKRATSTTKAFLRCPSCPTGWRSSVQGRLGWKWPRPLPALAARSPCSTSCPRWASCATPKGWPWFAPRWRPTASNCAWKARHKTWKLLAGGRCSPVTHAGETKTLALDEILLAAGRRPNIEGHNLEAAGVAYSNKGVSVNDRMQTSNSAIFGAGDVNSEQ